MKIENKSLNNTYQVSYYSSYKEFANQIGLQFWPAYVIFIISILLGLLTRYSDLALYLGMFSILMVIFCVIVTRFYANAMLEITEIALVITKKGQTTYFIWSDISNIVFIVPSHGASYRETVMAIYNNSNEIDYIIIESLYFKMANAKAREIGYLVEKYFKGFEFKIYRSDFYPLLSLKRKDIFPTIYQDKSN